MANELIIRKMQEIDIMNLQEEEIIALQRNLISNVNLNQMRKQVEFACRNLSQVAPPSFGADVRYIALDNQARLELIFKLLDSFSKFEQDVKCFRRNKSNCNNNFEYIFNFLLGTQDLVNAVIEHSDFKIKEWEENNKQLTKTKALEEKKLYLADKQ